MIRVTEVLDYFIEPELLARYIAWYERVGFKQAEQIRQEALWIGVAVDQAIQEELSGRAIHMIPSDAFQSCWSAWQSFKADHSLFPSTITGMQTELTDGEVIGHPDFEITELSLNESVRQEPGDLPGPPPSGSGGPPARFGIIDLKTSRAIRPRHWTQVAKYLQLKYPRALTESPFPYFVGILRLDKQTAQYEYQELTNPLAILDEVKVFDAYLTVYRHGQTVRERVRQQLEQEVLG